jgi:hypothetical protein
MLEIRRREFIATLGGAAAAWPVLVRPERTLRWILTPRPSPS